MNLNRAKGCCLLCFHWSPSPVIFWHGFSYAEDCPGKVRTLSISMCQLKLHRRRNPRVLLTDRDRSQSLLGIHSNCIDAAELPTSVSFVGIHGTSAISSANYLCFLRILHCPARLRHIDEKNIPKPSSCTHHFHWASLRRTRQRSDQWNTPCLVFYCVILRG